LAGHSTIGPSAVRPDKADRSAVTETDLFQQALTDGGAHAPLAARMRPRTLDELIGQDDLVGPGTALRRALEQDALGSMILQGPAGCGKSSLGDVIRRTTRHHFEHISAVMSGVADIRKVAAEARERLAHHQQRTILFVDEIHRLSKAQQDAFLPHVESGTFILIGATTENPYFTVITPLLSRTRLYAFRALESRDIERIVRGALDDAERGLGGWNVELTEEALGHLCQACEGDGRCALNALEFATLSATLSPDGRRVIDLPLIEEALQRRLLHYDRAGDEHYDVISAYIKSLRGSDPDAALYWLATMIQAGEDPRFISRRLVIASAEDVGLADPLALVVATAAAQAVDLVGWPEAQIPLAEATIYLATAPKSNSAYTAISRALTDVRERPRAAVPSHLRSGPRAGDSGRGAEYLYPHDHPGGHVAQEYLPQGTQSRTYYEPKMIGREARLAERLAALRGVAPDREPAPPEEGEATER